MTGGLLQLSGVVVDLVHRLDALPARGEEVEARAFAIAAGGGFNAMLAARRMGAGVSYGGTLGTGPFAEVAARALRDHGIAALAQSRVAADQGSCVVIVDASGERTFISHHGAERQVTRAHLDALPAARFGFALLSGYSLYKPETAAVFLPWLATLARPPLLLLDPGPIVAGIPPATLAAALARADWVSANAREAQVLCGEADPARAARRLAANRAGALVRCGADGCWLADGAAALHIPGFKVAVIDSTGAGDTHDGAFIAALLHGAAAHDAAVIANAAAALSTTRAGPATAPGRAELIAFLADHGCGAAAAVLTATSTGPNSGPP